MRQADGRADDELLFASEEQDTPEDWSPDGKYLAFDRGIGAKFDLWILPLEGDQEPFPLVEGAFDEGYSRFSPDGAWIGYISNESGRYELYLTRFPSGDGKWQLSTEGADWLVGWKQDGSEVYFMDLETRFCAVKVELGQQVVAGLPTCLFPTSSYNTWANSDDGERFMIGIPEEVAEGHPITMIVNWNPPNGS